MRKTIILASLILSMLVLLLYWRSNSVSGKAEPNPGPLGTPGMTVSAGAAASGPSGRAVPGPKLGQAADGALASPGPGAAQAASSPATVAAETGKISASALAQIAALEQDKDKRTPAQRKIASALLFAEKLRRNEPPAPGVKPFAIDLDRDPAGRVLVDIKARVSDGLLDEIRRAGGQIQSSLAAQQAVRAAVPLAAVEALAARPDVVFVQPAVQAEASLLTRGNRGVRLHSSVQGVPSKSSLVVVSAFRVLPDSDENRTYRGSLVPS